MKCPVCGAAELIRDTRYMPYAYKACIHHHRGSYGRFLSCMR